MKFYLPLEGRRDKKHKIELFALDRLITEKAETLTVLPGQNK